MRQTLATLAHSHPYDFLNWAFPEDETKSPFRFKDGFEPEPLSKISADALIKWCSESVDRWAIVAPHVPLFGSRDDANGEGAQLESLALDFLAAAPAPDIVLESYFRNLAPMSWSGSRADIMDRRLAVLKANVNSQLPEVCLVMQHRVPELSAYIERIRKKEHEEDQARNLSFE